MDLKRIKTVLIVILLAVNAFFLYKIISDYREDNYIDDATIDNACEILNKSGIEIDRDAVPGKKMTLAVYESLFYDPHNESVAETISGSRTEKTFSLPDGMRFIAENGDTVEFTGHFGILFHGGGAEKNADYSEMINNAMMCGESPVSESVYKNTKDKLTNDLSRTIGYAKFGAICTFTRHDEETGCSVVKFTQTIDGTPIYSHDVFCVFEGDELRYMSGLWCFLPTDEKFSSQHVDQINILFMEKKNIEKEREDDKNEAKNEETVYKIEKIDSVYCTYFNSDKSGVYFIPAWRITYANGRESVYDAGSGTKYVGVE